MSVVEGLKISRHEIQVRAASLVWQGDALVDWVGGSRVIHLDGRCDRPKVNWAYTFDAVTATPGGHFAIIYERTGTKALLLRDGDLLREMNRSFYHANVYDYPVCIWNAGDGRTLIAHCPQDYCRLDIEDANT
jgi:hypothetical protein